MTIETVTWIVVGTSLIGTLALSVGTFTLTRQRLARQRSGTDDAAAAQLERIAAELSAVSRRLATGDAKRRDA